MYLNRHVFVMYRVWRLKTKICYKRNKQQATSFKAFHFGRVYVISGSRGRQELKERETQTIKISSALCDSSLVADMISSHCEL